MVDPQKTVTETMSLRDAYIGLKACMWNGDEVYFRCKMSTRLQKLLIALCNCQGFSLDEISACFDGQAFSGDQTPLDLGMQNGDVIDVVQANGKRKACDAESWSTLTDDEARQLLPVAEGAFDAILLRCSAFLCDGELDQMTDAMAMEAHRLPEFTETILGCIEQLLRHESRVGPGDDDESYDFTLCAEETRLLEFWGGGSFAILHDHHYYIKYAMESKRQILLYEQARREEDAEHDRAVATSHAQREDLRVRSSAICTFFSGQLNENLASLIAEHGAATLVQAAARGLRHRRIPPDQLGHVRFPVAVLRAGFSAASTARWFRMKMDQAVIPYLDAMCLSDGVLIRERRYLYDGDRLQRVDTPRSLDMEHGESLDIMGPLGG